MTTCLSLIISLIYTLHDIYVIICSCVKYCRCFGNIGVAVFCICCMFPYLSYYLIFTVYVCFGRSIDKKDQAYVPLIFCLNCTFDQDIFTYSLISIWSQQNIGHTKTDVLIWYMQSFIVIISVLFKLQWWVSGLDQDVISVICARLRYIIFNLYILIHISLNFLPKTPTDNIKSSFVQIMAWHRSDDTPLSKSMMEYFTDAHMRHSVGFLIAPMETSDMTATI